MAFQIVGIGDWHQKSTSHRNAARLKALDQILREGVQLPALAAWLQVGDVYDSRPTGEDRNTVAGSLVAMAQQAPVMVVGGNHCAPGDLDRLGTLASRWPIHVVTNPTVLSLTLATGQPAHVACLPYPHRASLVAAGTNRSEMLDVGMQALQDTCRRLATELTQACRTGGVGLFAAHVNVEGAIAGN
jgi:DNA repair exonuclease SbcCD nuclease subunit